MNSVETIEVTLWREKGLNPETWLAFASLPREVVKHAEEPDVTAAEAARWAADMATAVRAGNYYGKGLRHVLFVLSVQPLQRLWFLSWLMSYLAGGRDLNDPTTWFEIGADHERMTGGVRLPDDVRVTARMAAERLGVAFCTGRGDFTSMIRDDLDAILFFRDDTEPAPEPITVCVALLERGYGEKQGEGTTGPYRTLENPRVADLLPPRGECMQVERL